MLLSLPLRWSCVARERMEFINEVATFPRQQCTRGHGMTCAQWTWNTRGLTTCPIQDLLGISPTDDLRTHSKPSASWRCGGFPACTQVICAVDYVWNTRYVWNPCMDLCRLCPQVLSQDFWKSLPNIQNYLLFLSRFFFFFLNVFGEIWLYGYHVCYAVVTCKETSTLLEVCILLLRFLIFTVFCIWNYLD